MNNAGVVSDDRVRGYLERLGVDAPPAPSLAALRALHVAHLRRIPFENLSIHLSEPIALDAGALVAKIVDQRRGGFCYELNGAFGSLLAALGFRVTMLAARVFDGDVLGPPFDHMCLRVDLDEPWLADVGFGDNFLLPLRLDARGEQVDATGRFRLVDAGHGVLDLLRDGVASYRFDLQPRDFTDYEPTCLYHQTSADSHFTRNTVCSLATTDGRITIRGHTLIVTRAGERTQQTLDDNDLIDAYREHFGIHLAALPSIDQTTPVDR